MHPSSWRAGVWVLVAGASASACGDERGPRPPVSSNDDRRTEAASTDPSSSPRVSSYADASSLEGSPSRTSACIVVQSSDASSPVVIEGVLNRPKSSGGFVLRLDAPRCVAGVPRTAVVTEVDVATSGPDLRPFIGARVRVTGDALVGKSDLGGWAIVLIAKDIARLEPRAHEL